MREREREREREGEGAAEIAAFSSRKEGRRWQPRDKIVAHK